MNNDQPTIGQAVEAKPIGRPQVINELVVNKLEDILRLGTSDKTACAYAGISRETFYNKIKNDEEFSDRIQKARDYAVIAARNVIVKTITSPDSTPEEKLETSKWYLGNHELKNAGPTQQTQVNVFSQLKEMYTIKTEEKKDDVIVTETVVTEKPKNE